MKPTIDVFTMLLLLAGYYYTKHSLHMLLSSTGHKTFESFYKTGQLEMASIATICRTGESIAPEMVKKAMRLVRVNHSIVFLSFGLALVFLLTEATK